MFTFNEKVISYLCKDEQKIAPLSDKKREHLSEVPYLKVKEKGVDREEVKMIN